MTTLIESITKLQTSVGKKLNWQLFLQDNITGSWFQAIGVFTLALITALYTAGQLNELPFTTIIVLVLWLVGIVLVVWGELFSKHSNLSRWLKGNLLSSVVNTLITLLVGLFLVSAINGIIQWGFVNATFDAARTAPEFQVENGATWGVVWGARKLLLTGLLSPDLSWRVWLSLGFILALWVSTYFTGRPSFKERLRIVRLVTNGLWLLSPIILYIFLAGIPNESYNIIGALTGLVVLVSIYLLLWWQKVVQFSIRSFVITAATWPVLYTIWWGIGLTDIFAPINVDDWGGLLLTLIIASSVIVLSLPLGMVLALGRRSEVFGIPGWITWPIAFIAAIWGFTTSTPELLATSRNLVEQIMSFWPVLILGAAFVLQNYFRGNVVSGASTVFIELIRSVPLITLLFMGIVMAPFFITGSAPAKPWPVIVGYTLFSSAYMAETIRGGLQAIPKGQYEAADALGFNGLQKMRFIILPQALRIVIPPIVGQFIGAFKSSSLVSIVGLFDLLGIQKAILANAQWQGLRIELYVSLAVIYFMGSYLMSSYSRRLELQLSTDDRPQLSTQ